MKWIFLRKTHPLRVHRSLYGHMLIKKLTTTLPLVKVFYRGGGDAAIKN
jgi:hypothetical protein